MRHPLADDDLDRILDGRSPERVAALTHSRDSRA
jgi:hypothetical protein